MNYSASSLLLLATLLAAAPVSGSETHSPERSTYHAPHAEDAPIIDGVADEAIWQSAEWRDIKYRWLGPEFSAEDFSGRFKVVWTEDKLYILTEAVDDVLIDRYRDPLVRYWDDDSLEIFIDEDHSGGEHQYNHNAFAYHMSLDNQAIDIGTNEKPHNYSHHAESQWKQTGNHVVWEVAFDIYPDSYVDGGTDNEPVKLEAGKIMGLMLAWCDNDGSELRENFIGSEAVLSGATDRGWIDAGLFGTLVLAK